MEPLLRLPDLLKSQIEKHFDRWEFSIFDDRHFQIPLSELRSQHLVREGGLEDESIVNKDLQVHLERYLHPGSPHLSHSAPWKDFGLLQPAYQMLTVINQPIQNHRAR
jgi:hypothetical protein